MSLPTVCSFLCSPSLAEHRLGSAHELGIAEGRKGSQGCAAPHAPTGQEDRRPKLEEVGKALHLGCVHSQAGQTCLEKAEMSRQDTSLCP